MIELEYSSNNSGGRWWLKDEHWLALEKAGWKVEWERDRNTSRLGGRKKRKPEERWLGALATRASKKFETPADGIREFESITGESASDEGCNCCGAPHCFSWDTKDGGSEYASGEEVLRHLYEDAPRSLRDAAERLSRRRP